MSNGLFKIPTAANEPIKDYAPGSPERASLKKEIERQSKIKIEIPAIIDGKPYITSNKEYIVMPHDHNHVLAEVSIADDEGIELAIQSSLAAREKWDKMPWQHRASIFIKALNLVRGPWRDRLIAATMLGQSKTCFQAEIDAACEVCDFFSYNLAEMQEIYEFQPRQTPGAWNRMEYRGLDGFVLAISPFNFTALGANLSCAPAIMGNTVIWKPARTAMLSNYYFYQMLLEAGLPPGVINFLPASGSAVSRLVVPHPKLAGLNFTGSDSTFSTLWGNIGNNISTYHQYPRMVGETGGKDFIFVHPSAEIPPLISAMVRGAFEYQGQKCAAASRAYVPRSLWPQVKEMLLAKTAEIKVGDPSDFTNLMAAVIDRSAFDSIKSYIDYARESDEAEVLTGHYDDSKGYFVYPTIIETTNPRFKTMREEIFGPVLTIYVYEDDELDSAVRHCKEDTIYALTGSIFAQSREAIVALESEFNYTAGNIYINDKPTGSTVGLQPFGGSMMSGTNDKTGTKMNLYRWISARTIKENFVPTDDVNYISMQER